MKKVILLILTIVIFIPFSVHAEEYDRYTCLADTIIEECEGSELFAFTNISESAGPLLGVISNTSYSLTSLSNYSITTESMRELLIDLKSYYTQINKRLLNKHYTDLIITCEATDIVSSNPSKDQISDNQEYLQKFQEFHSKISGGKTLSFKSDHFLWKDSTIDCASIKNEYNIELNGRCPTFILGDKNSLVLDCQDVTFSLTIKKLAVFSFSLFGGILVLKMFIKRRNKKKSKN